MRHIPEGPGPFDSNGAPRIGTRIQRTAIIPLFNYEALLEGAFNSAFKFKLDITSRHIALMLATSQDRRQCNEIPAMILLETTMALLNKSAPTARKYIKRAVDQKAISVYEDGRSRLYFFTPEQAAAFNRAAYAWAAIVQAVKAQMEQPTLPEAGRGLVPDDIFFNIVDVLQTPPARKEPKPKALKRGKRT